MPDASPVGKVYLVGCGPGDAGLLTIKGRDCLQGADVVLYDYLCNPDLLKFVSNNAEIHCLGSHAKRKIWSQAEINQEMIRQAQLGRRVVRLKSGDPTIFARAGDEISALAAANISFEIVPGVTTALAASAYTGIPVTHSKYASAVAFVTGHEKPGKSAGGIDWAALAQFPGTLVLYMGVTTAPEWTAGLIDAGKSPETPAAIIRRCSWPDQETYRCTLEEIPQFLHSGSKIRPPVIVVVGEVAGEPTQPSWFETRPLFGQSILITRPEHQAEALQQPLEALGAEVIVQPAISIGPPQDWQPVDQVISRLTEFDWLVFSSRNGVNYFLQRLLQQGNDLRQLGHLKIAGIGPGTAEELARYHLCMDEIPDEYRAEALVETLAPLANGTRFLLPRASRGRDILPVGLTQAGGVVEEVVAYHSADVVELTTRVSDRIDSGAIDWIVVTSSAIARATANLMPEKLKQGKIVSISPITTATLNQLGYEVDVEARRYDMPGIVAAILEAVGKSSNA